MTAFESSRMGVPDLSAGSRSRAAVIRRLRRIEGQARGLQKMVDEGRNGDEILGQIASVREALYGVAAIVLEDYLASSAESVMRAGSEAEGEELIANAVRIFKKWVP
ncbi:MAG TPA: metal-sensitive transcriptional regulator [Gemmatimonadales bacterium]